MADVTVSQLAEVVGASVDRLLKQMAEAGLKHESPDDMVTDEEKQKLLAYLKSLHGEKASEPRKITLRRKTVSTLKTGARKTVNVEVRKKKTYVKREEMDDVADSAEELHSHVEEHEVEQDAVAEPVVETSVEEIVAEAPVVEEPVAVEPEAAVEEAEEAADEATAGAVAEEGEQARPRQSRAHLKRPHSSVQCWWMTLKPCVLPR